jgi:hypothetical protein
VARDVIAACSQDPSLQGAGLFLSTASTPDGDTKESLFLAGELAAAQEAQAYITALNGITPVDVTDLSQLSMKNDNSTEALHNFLAYRSTIALTGPPLIIEFPHEDDQSIAGDLIMVRYNASTFLKLRVFNHVMK